jgi:cytidine deaminase
MPSVFRMQPLLEGGTLNRDMDRPSSALLSHARALLGGFSLGGPDCTAGFVAAAIQAQSGKIYSGICLDLPCGIGFCAEHAAAADMLKSRETRVQAIVAVSSAGVLPPCGRCRELLVLLDPGNLDTQVFIAEDRMALLRDLIPQHWLSRVL